ncbi:MAG: hypothetical protein H8E28_15965 [Anaerolineae bacterium]|nr:hypothetical protein [Anaerolineae bacterium]
MSKKHIALTVIGPGKRGTVARITEVFVNNDASIEESHMVRLGGEFAVIMLLGEQ